MAGDPGQGGATWAVLQYVLGLRALGHEVVFVEPVEEGGLRHSAPYFRHVVDRFGLRDSAALIDPASGETVGLCHSRVREAAIRSDLLLNISGLLADEELIGAIPVRAFVDLDPAFTQLWAAAEGIDMGFDRHNRFVTIGGRIGSDGCTVPTCGREWIPTLQPLVLSEWPEAGDGVETDALTTVGHWRAYGSIEHGGVHYGQKAHSLRPLVELPERTEAHFAPALGIHPDERDDLDALARHGWELLDPARVAATPDDYAAFVRGSWAEFGLAKSGYAASACGWFSDRSVCYLAAGRPVLAMDTGFTPAVPSGEGVIAFSTLDEAVAGVESLRAGYRAHRRAARQIAEDLFDSNRVLPELLGCL